MNILENSSGSAQRALGEAPLRINIICAVNGPLEAKHRDELPQHASLEVVYRRNIGIPMIRERFIQDRVHSAILSVIKRDAYPRSVIQVVVQALDSCHDADISFYSEISEGINTACLALVNAGIELSALVVAKGYIITDEGEILDLNQPLRKKTIESKHAVAFRIAQNTEPKLVLCESSGPVKDDLFMKMLRKAENDTKLLAEEEFRKTIVDSL